jgi:hypothetical protein
MIRSTLCVSLTAVAFHAMALDAPAGLSPALQAGADEQPAFMLAAQGVQIYECKPRANDPSAFAWSLTAPEAALSEGGAAVGRHYAGPTWESTRDRSSVKGAVRQRQDGGAGNIPWLLLAATPSASEGRFAGVTSVQRVATHGGVEPAGGCDASSVGREVRVPYTADYYFYKRKS